MLHENEPGAWDFARALAARGVPLDCDSAARRRRPDRVRPARRATSCARGRRSCTRISCTPTRTGCSPAARRACRSASRRSTASTSSARRRTSDSPTAPSRASRTSTSRSRGGSPGTSKTSRASTARASRSSTTASTRDGEPTPYAGPAPRLLCVGRLIPIKGHIVLLRAFAEAKKRAAGAPARHRGPRAARAGAERARARARRRRLGALPRPRQPDPGGDRALGRRRRAVDGRGLRDGRARGDGARAAGDRRGDRRPRRARPRRRDRAARAGRRGGAAARRDRRASPATSSSHGGWARPAGGARSRVSCSSSAPTGPSCCTRARSGSPNDEVGTTCARTAGLSACACLEGQRHERGHAPTREKHALLRDTARSHDLRILVETGTYTGETAWTFRNDFDRIETIELEPTLVRLAASASTARRRCTCTRATARPFFTRSWNRLTDLRSSGWTRIHAPTDRRRTRRSCCSRSCLRSPPTWSQATSFWSTTCA